MRVFNLRSFNILLISTLVLFASCKTSYYQATVSNKQMLAIDNSIAEDSSISNYIEPYKVQLDAAMNRVIGVAPENMIHNRNLPETNLSNFFIDALLAIGKKIDPEVSFSLATKDGIRSSIKEGDVTVRTIFELMPFENYVTILELKGSDVMTLANFIAKSNGQPVGNVKIKIKDKQLVDFKINNEAIDPNKTYKLVTYDFVANGGDHVEGLSNPIQSHTSSERVREALISHIEELTKAGKKVEAKLDGRVEIIK
ncbi:5'-nucleotidase C-terminal domain-containing protein [Sphingobacterium sp.]|uniref:5'-nucleotidase C-terminal domain-containing protein n=1 Tax=Sphingobacterium sp. TaxID=341027 RepID=UPI002896B763|nr:5'-nucleotidase C-terminal domain-containing protein [Sphingobacterium sp.]